MKRICCFGKSVNITLPKSFILPLNVDISELSHREQTYQPIKMVVQNSQHQQQWPEDICIFQHQELFDKTRHNW